jgi:hypothetical protein
VNRAFGAPLFGGLKAPGALPQAIGENAPLALRTNPNREARNAINAIGVRSIPAWGNVPGVIGE